MIGTLLEDYYKSVGGLKVKSSDWHKQSNLDSFPGHYFTQCML